MSCQKRSHDTVDPDYVDVDCQQAKRLRALEEDAKQLVSQRIQNIIKAEFQKEISFKESELQQIDKRLNEARLMLDRLRACIVATYYGKSDYTTSAQTTSANAPPPSIHTAVKKYLGKAPSHYTVSSNENQQLNPWVNNLNDDKIISTLVGQETQASQQLTTVRSSQPSSSSVPSPSVSKPPIPESSTYDDRRSRLKIKKKIIVGNVSKYIPIDHREANDMSSHKWMVYVRGPKTSPDISGFVKKVWFFLHHSYKPNDLVEVSSPPFHLTRRGWGEFPVRVQLHFVDPRNKKVDVIHHLKLDKTFTGLQTPGAETVVEVDLDRDFFEAQDGNMVNGLLIPQFCPPVMKREVFSDKGLKSLPPKPTNSAAAVKLEAKAGRASGIKKPEELASQDTVADEEMSDGGDEAIPLQCDEYNVTIAHDDNTEDNFVDVGSDSEQRNLDVKSCISKPTLIAESIKSNLNNKARNDEAKEITLNLQKGIKSASFSKLLTQNNEEKGSANVSCVSDQKVVLAKAALDISVGESVTVKKESLMTKMNFSSFPPVARTACVVSAASVYAPTPVSSTVLLYSYPSLVTAQSAIASPSMVQTSSSSSLLTPLPVHNLLATRPKTPAIDSSKQIIVQPVTNQKAAPAKSVTNLSVSEMLVVKNEPSLPKVSSSATLMAPSVVKMVSVVTAPPVVGSMPKLSTTSTQLVKATSSSGHIASPSLPITLLPGQNLLTAISQGQASDSSKKIIFLPPSALNKSGAPAANSRVVVNSCLQLNESKALPNQTIIVLDPKLPGNAKLGSPAGSKLSSVAHQTPTIKPSAPKQVSLLTGRVVQSVQTSAAQLIPSIQSNRPNLSSGAGQQTIVLSKSTNQMVVVNNPVGQSTSDLTSFNSQQSSPNTTSTSVVIRNANPGVSLVGPPKFISLLKHNDSIQQSVGMVPSAQTVSILPINMSGNVIKMTSLDPTLTCPKMSAVGLTKHGKNYLRAPVPKVERKVPTVEERVRGQYEVLRAWKENPELYERNAVKNKKIVLAARDRIEGEAEDIPELIVEDYSNMSALVKEVVKLHPLILENVNRLTHPYCAHSLDQWMQWPVGKQRAYEWHRACFVLRYLKSCLKGRTEFLGERLMTKRELVQWCRLHAFSPTAAGKALPSKQTETDIVKTTNVTRSKPTSSYTPLIDLDGELYHSSAAENVDDIDVMMLSTENSCLKMEIKKEIDEMPSATLLVPPMEPDGAGFVFDELRKRGLKLEATELEPGVISMAASDMLYKVMLEFASDVVRESASVLSHRGEQVLTRQIVHFALTRLPEAGFCCDRFLGKEEDEDDDTAIR